MLAKCSDYIQWKCTSQCSTLCIALWWAVLRMCLKTPSMSDWSVHCVVICNLGNNTQDIVACHVRTQSMLISTCVGVYSFSAPLFHLGQTLMEAVAEYDYDAQDDDDLTFQEGQIIREVTVLDEGWSEGRLLHNGQYSMFPNNYVEMRRAAPIEHLPPPVGEFSMLSM